MTDTKSVASCELRSFINHGKHGITRNYTEKLVRVFPCVSVSSVGKIIFNFQFSIFNFLSLLASLFLVLLTCFSPVLAQEATATNQAKFLSKAFREATKKALPAVVQIKNSNNIEMPAIGSGAVIEKSGVILTNNHVIEGEKNLYVQLTDGRIYKVIQVRTDPYTDLAVLQIKPEEELVFAQLGDSDAMDIGDWVLAIGAPFSLDQSVSAGIISAKDRSIPEMPRTTMIQTDAAINPGNSGGPLINLDGDIIGITSAIYTTKGNYEGVSFAIPSNTARWACSELLRYGKVRRSYLGVATSPVAPQTIRAMGIPIRPAVKIARFLEHSPAEKSGLKIGDIILEYNNQPIKTASDIQRCVEQTPAGSIGKLTIYRENGQPSPLMMIQVKVESMPDDFMEQATNGSSNNGEDIQVFQSDELGFSAIDLHRQLAEKIKMQPNSGIYVMDVSQNTPAYFAGLRKGVIIEACNGMRITTVNGFIATLGHADLSRGIALTVRVNGRPTTVILRH